MLGLRPDGFHEVETVLLALDWGDDVEVRLEGSEGVRLDVEGGERDVPTGEQNLAWRAAAAYATAAHRSGRPLRCGVHLRLVKRVPPGAGLGGGSSDAATVLACLEEEAGALGAPALHDLAATLGSDVPFFLLPSGAAVARGRGERLTALDTPPPLDVVLILPGTLHDTARVYGHVSPSEPLSGVDAAAAALASGEAKRVRAAHRNALLAAALAAYPGFASFMEEVTRRLGRAPALSGSGSTLFDVPAAGEVDDVLRRLEGLPGRVLHVRSRP